MVNRTQCRDPDRGLADQVRLHRRARRRSRVIPPGTQTTIEATIDTTRFQGPKASGLTLVLDRPAFDQIDLNMTCFIRGDIALNPGQIDFGTVRPTGKLPSAALTLTYAGGPDVPGRSPI